MVQSFFIFQHLSFHCKEWCELWNFSNKLQVSNLLSRLLKNSLSTKPVGVASEPFKPQLLKFLEVCVVIVTVLLFCLCWDLYIQKPDQNSSSVGRDRDWGVPGKFLCCLLYQMLTWNGVLMPEDMSMWFYSFRIGDTLLSHHLIENKIFILPDRYKKLFVCGCSWQLCNFQAGQSLLPCYFF